MKKKLLFSIVGIAVIFLLSTCAFIMKSNASEIKSINNRNLEFVYNKNKLPVKTLNLKDIEYEYTKNIINGENVIYNNEKLKNFVNLNFDDVSERTQENVLNEIKEQLNNNETNSINLYYIISENEYKHMIYNDKIENFIIELKLKDKTGIDDIKVDAMNLVYKSGQDYIISDEKVEELVKDISDTYKTKNKYFINHDGNKQLIPDNNSNYGWEVDEESLTSAIKDVLCNACGSINVPFLREGKKYDLELNNDIGDTYIEVSIDEQHIWYHKDNKIIYDCDTVTGKSSTPTPLGEFHIMEKLKDKIMVGENYRTYTEYWLRVTETGIGIHAANWRSKFGGNIYTYDGSHGCMNISVEDAHWFYDNIDVDTPVIIY